MNHPSPFFIQSELPNTNITSTIQLVPPSHLVIYCFLWVRKIMKMWSKLYLQPLFGTRAANFLARANIIYLICDANNVTKLGPIKQKLCEIPGYDEPGCLLNQPCSPLLCRSHLVTQLKIWSVSNLQIRLRYRAEEMASGRCTNQTDVQSWRVSPWILYKSHWESEFTRLPMGTARSRLSDNFWEIGEGYI